LGKKGRRSKTRKLRKELFGRKEGGKGVGEGGLEKKRARGGVLFK